jgi:uncharacterized protein YecE (DUF72 family)
MSKFLIGTCSWKYDSWKGILYPEKTNINYLEEYAKHYDTVEVDQWFWSLFGEKKISLPKQKDVLAYKESIPETFEFSVKVPNSITLTHFYRRSKKEGLKRNPHFFSVELFNDFMTTLEPLHPYLGPLMFQFEYLNKQKMPTQFEFQLMFSEFLEKLPENFSYGIEIRNPNYLNKSFFNFVEEHDLTFVFLQGYYMPSIFEVYEKFQDYIKNETVIRMHGPNRKEIEKESGGNWDKILAPKDRELDSLAEMIHAIRTKEVDIYLNINNHYEGSAPLTIERIKQRLSD